ncbi:hypothetical protein BDL97_08G094400 [Sphagnum fallax]|nr:hypothetical protein BDL97_08G094400 [Sphagnum fallax]
MASSFANSRMQISGFRLFKLRIQAWVPCPASPLSLSPSTDLNSVTALRPILTSLVSKAGLGIMAVHAVNLFRLKDFLKGIDGFDDQRAEICLARLIAMHYDDVNVLKLATKQDLVEDAGILPGDAVRIIAAAKGVVVHTDAGHHDVPHWYECKVSDQVQTNTSVQVPTVSQASSPCNQPQQAQFQFVCSLCDIFCTCKKNLRGHFRGKKHTAQMLRVETKDLIGHVPGKLYHCRLCNVKNISKNDLVAHLRGKKHARHMNETSDEEESD